MLFDRIEDLNCDLSKKIMRNIFFLFCAVFFASALEAQITITSADLPRLGDTYITNTDTTANSVTVVSNGLPSASFQSWNFSSLTSDYLSDPTYGATSWTSYAAAFPASNLYTYGPAALYSSFCGAAPVGTQGMNKGYMFWQEDNTGFRIVGFRSDSGTYANRNITENPMELLIGTPATYGTVFTNTGRWELPMNLQPLDVDTFYVNRVVKTLTCDAWGSIQTPNQTYPSVLRIHEHMIRYDSAYARIGTTLVYAMELKRDTLNNYMYIANNVHYPVCIVHADVHDVNKSIEYYYTVLASIPEHSTFSNTTNVFPNPVISESTIEISTGFNLDNASICYFDLMGKLTMNKEISSRSIQVNSNDFAEGVYFYTIQNAIGEILNGKVSIVK